MPVWFKPFLVILAGLILLLLADAPRAGSARSAAVIDPTAFRLIGAALMGLGVFYGLTILRAPSTPTPARSRRKRS